MTRVSFYHDLMSGAVDTLDDDAERQYIISIIKVYDPDVPFGVDDDYDDFSHMMHRLYYLKNNTNHQWFRELREWVVRNGETPEMYCVECTARTKTVHRRLLGDGKQELVSVLSGQVRRYVRVSVSESLSAYYKLVWQ